MRHVGWFNVVGLLGALSALSLLGCVMLFTTHMDRAAETGERDRIAIRAAADIAASKASIEAWAHSDEAIRRLDHGRDVAWAETTFPDIGSAAVKTYTFDHADRLLSGGRRGGTIERGSSRLEAALPARIAALRPAAGTRGMSGDAGIDFFWLHGTMYMLVVAPFTPVSPSLKYRHRKPPILAAVSPYTGFVRASMASDGLGGLAVSRDIRSDLRVRDAAGRVVGSLVGEPSHPGADLRDVILWPSLALSLALIALLLFAQARAETERRKLIASEERASHLALHDQLTGLGNRRYLLEALERQVADATRTGSSVALLLIDLDRFKMVNDTYGHACGDELIRETATRLRSVCVARQDVCARLGGDEFVILAARCDPPAATRLAERVLEALSRPVTISSTEVRTGCSVGVACLPSGASPDVLLRAADQALYRANNDGRNTARLATGQRAAA